MNAKPLASLTSTLLARKGQAKPAMRPQGFGGFAPSQEDLGWNDMGYDALRPAPEPPVIVRQQEELVARLDADKIAPRIAAQRKPAAGTAPRGPKAAFTLRLDADRHLRLRLASAVKHVSAQQLVTQALDALLNDVPDLDELAARAKKQPIGK